MGHRIFPFPPPFFDKLLSSSPLIVAQGWNIYLNVGRRCVGFDVVACVNQPISFDKSLEGGEKIGGRGREDLPIPEIYAKRTPRVVRLEIWLPVNLNSSRDDRDSGSLSYYPIARGSIKNSLLRFSLRDTLKRASPPLRRIFFNPVSGRVCFGLLYFRGMDLRALKRKYKKYSW